MQKIGQQNTFLQKLEQKDVYVVISASNEN